MQHKHPKKNYFLFKLENINYSIKNSTEYCTLEINAHSTDYTSDYHLILSCQVCKLGYSDNGTTCASENVVSY